MHLLDKLIVVQLVQIEIVFFFSHLALQLNKSSI